VNDDKCVRCGSAESVHMHHWAPRAVFEDHDLWGTIALCSLCHVHWHAVMTPGMRRNPRPPASHLIHEYQQYHHARHVWANGCDHHDCRRQTRDPFTRELIDPCPERDRAWSVIESFHAKYPGRRLVAAAPGPRYADLMGLVGSA